jgi:hypothetical protein
MVRQVLPRTSRSIVYDLHLAGGRSAEGETVTTLILVLSILGVADFVVGWVCGFLTARWRSRQVQTPRGDPPKGEAR